MRDRKGRWRSANPTQTYLRASSRPSLGISSPSLQPQLALPPTEEKWGKSWIGAAPYWELRVCDDCVCVEPKHPSHTQQSGDNLKLQGKVKIAHPPSHFPICCTNYPGTQPWAWRASSQSPCLPAAPLEALAQVMCSLWLEIPPGIRGTCCFPQGRSEMNEKEGWKAPQLTWDSWSGNIYSWVKCPELLLWSTERNRHHGAVQITPK